MIFSRDRNFYKTFNSLYWILILHNIITFSVNLADNVMIGSYSETALSGVAAVNQIQFIFQQIVMGCGDAAVVICSQYWGQGRTSEIRKIIGSALYTGAAFSVIVFAAASLFPSQIVGLFTTSPAIVAQGSEYIRIIRFTYPLFALTNIFLAGLRSVETVRIGFVVSVMTLLINCSVNYALIGGHFGAPELGVTGAAIGTLAARFVEFAVVVVYVFFIDKKLRSKLSDLLRPGIAAVRDYLKNMWRFTLVGAMFGVSTALQTVVLGHMQDAAIAANSAATTLYQVLKVASVGASSAAAVIIGKLIGSSDSIDECLPKLKEYVRTLQAIFLLIGITTGVLLYILREPVLSLYSSLSPEAYSMAKQFILVLCFTGVGTAYEMPVITGIIRGGGDSLFVLINDLVSIWGIVLPLSFCAAFVFNWPPVAVVLRLNSDQIFKCGVAAIKANRYHWMKKLTRGEKAA